MLGYQRSHSADFAQESGSQERPSRQSGGRVSAVEAMGSRRRDRSQQSSQDSGELSLWGAASVSQSGDGPQSEDGPENAAPSLAEIDSGEVVVAMQSGPAVEWVQGALTRLGFPVAQTGTFGPMTADLLRQFQTANQVAATGEVGPTTLARLRAAVAASVSLDELQQLAPGVDRSTLEEYLPHLNAAMLQHNITSDTRKAAFLAQLGHESDGFNTLEEYASGSDYEGRTDLGNIFPGDGERFKGRGPIQITGRYNYGQYSDKLGVDLIDNPELAATPELGFQIAGQYWADQGLNELADEGRFDTITQRINGGQNGAHDRRRRLGQAQDVLAQSAGLPKVDTSAELHEGPTPQVDSPAANTDAGDTQDNGTTQLAEICARIGDLDATGARQAAARFAAERRASLGVANDALTRAAGKVWTAADLMIKAVKSLEGGDRSAAKDAAHSCAETLRALRDVDLIPAESVENGIARAGSVWGQADQQEQSAQQTTGQAHDGRAVWSTGRTSAGGGVTSRELNRDGGWTDQEFLQHHSDRSNSWAAGNIRNDKNRDLQAYDFTFERQSDRGDGIAGSAQGLELISPWDARVHDVNASFEQSGGYGKFIALEDVETGLRFEVHHLDTVADVARGGSLDGGEVIGTQGGSGYGRHDYATHVDIVGTAEAVEQFVRANQSGRFRSRKKPAGA